jgi:hypothetical protein
MKAAIEDLYKRAEAVQEKYDDSELRDYLLGLATKLQEADVMYHHFAYLVMHVRSTVAHTVRPPHLREAIQRAHQFLENYDRGDK